MYLESFGLKENPFTLVTDPRFMYYSESHCDAMAHLLYGVRERKGIMMMLGEAGTGKTTLVKATLDMLRSTRVVSSVILNPILSATEDFFDVILRGFGLDGFKRNNVEMADVLQRFLLQQSRRGRIPKDQFPIRPHDRDAIAGTGRDKRRQGEPLGGQLRRQRGVNAARFIHATPTLAAAQS